MSSIEKGSVEYMLRLTHKLHANKIITSCLTCINFDESKELCKLVNLKPPAKTIAYGCAKWDEGMPF